MTTDNIILSRLLDAVVDNLDIPKSYYEKATARHRSLGTWLCRPESKLARFDPKVSPQGSFRHGTVNRPLVPTERYDLDNVTTIALAKADLTQKQLKELYGEEVRAYAEANGISQPPEEKGRCWRLVYADEVGFHLDTLPSLEEDAAVIQGIVARGVPNALAVEAIAITDRKHPKYEQRTRRWLSSNPRGFATWFEARTRPIALAKIARLVEARVYASVDDVPPYEWKTPLQRSIQVLKRHRDVMFRNNPAVAPISMIITNLAAQAYRGETDLWSATTNILERIPLFVLQTSPRVPNPADPAEDYADKWRTNPQLEQYFWQWHAQAKADIARIAAARDNGRIAHEVRGAFDTELSREQRATLGEQAVGSPILPPPPPTIEISGAPRPWRERA